MLSIYDSTNTGYSLYLSPVNDGVCWNQIAITISATQMNGYVNGTLVASTAINGFPQLTCGAPLSLATRGAGQLLPGLH